MGVALIALVLGLIEWVLEILVMEIVLNVVFV